MVASIQERLAQLQTCHRWSDEQSEELARVIEETPKAIPQIESEIEILVSINNLLEKRDEECACNSRFVKSLLNCLLRYSQRIESSLAYDRYVACLRILVSLVYAGQSPVAFIEHLYESTQNVQVFTTLCSRVLLEKSVLAQYLILEAVCSIAILLKRKSKDKKRLETLLDACPPILRSELKSDYVGPQKILDNIPKFQEKKLNIAGTGSALRTFPISSVATLMKGKLMSNKKNVLTDKGGDLNLDHFHLEIYLEEGLDAAGSRIRIPYRDIAGMNFALNPLMMQLTLDSHESIRSILTGKEAEPLQMMISFTEDEAHDEEDHRRKLMTEIKAAMDARMHVNEGGSQRASAVSTLDADANDLLVEKTPLALPEPPRRSTLSSVNTTRDSVSPQQVPIKPAAQQKKPTKAPIDPPQEKKQPPAAPPAAMRAAKTPLPAAPEVFAGKMRAKAPLKEPETKQDSPFRAPAASRPSSTASASAVFDYGSDGEDAPPPSTSRSVEAATSRAKKATTVAPIGPAAASKRPASAKPAAEESLAVQVSREVIPKKKPVQAAPAEDESLVERVISRKKPAPKPVVEEELSAEESPEVLPRKKAVQRQPSPAVQQRQERRVTAQSSVVVVADEEEADIYFASQVSAGGGLFSPEGSDAEVEEAPVPRTRGAKTKTKRPLQLEGSEDDEDEADTDSVVTMLVKELCRMQQERVAKKRSRQMAQAEQTVIEQCVDFLEDWTASYLQEVGVGESLGRRADALLHDADKLCQRVNEAAKRLAEEQALTAQELVQMEIQMKSSGDDLTEAALAEAQEEIKSFENFLVKRKKQCVDAFRTRTGHVGSREPAPRKVVKKDSSKGGLSASAWENI